MAKHKAVGLVLLAAAALVALAAAAGQMTRETSIQWTSAAGTRKVLTLYADGTFATAGIRNRVYKWAWTQDGLRLTFVNGRYIFRPVVGEPGHFSGELMKTKPDEKLVAVRIAIEGADGAGVLTWLQPIIDGPQPSALERIADAQAQQIVLTQLSHELARLDAADGADRG